MAAGPTMASLLEAVASQPDLAASALGVKSAEVQLQQARAELYPTLSAFGNYTMYSSPTNLRAMPPTEVIAAAFGTIAGMIPIALEWAVGLERLSPLADVAIGGLPIGTILTLIYIPMVAYSVERGRKGTEKPAGV